MPELPETETIARDLDAELRGRTIEAVKVRRADVLREASARTLARRTRGQRIERVWRRAKLVVLDLASGDRIAVQPRFTGALLLESDDRPLPARERAFSTLDFRLDDERRLHYRDIRRLGTVALMPPARWLDYSSALGIEPLETGFTPDRLSGILRRSRQAIKKVLMDQRHVVGIGNIYANESLWRAGILPGRAARSLADSECAALHAAITGVLAESIALRGTSFRDYVDARGQRGGFVERLAAYGRAGLPCPRCGDALDCTQQVDGRQTVFCARCQR